MADQPKRKKKKTGRKSKYNDVVVDAICDAIALTNSVEEACKAADISHQTYFKWLKEKDEFLDAVAKAKKEFRDSLPAVQKRKALKWMNKYLDGEFETTWRTTGKKTRTQYGEVKVDEDGQLTRIMKGQIEEELDVTKAFNAGCPKWVIERVLGEPFDEISAIAKLVKSGWLPTWVLQAAREKSIGFRHELRSIFESQLPGETETGKLAGISEETADFIRGSVLGVDAEDSVTVSAEVVSGSFTPKSWPEVAADWD